MRNKAILWSIAFLELLRRDRHVVPDNKSSGLLAMTILVWMKKNSKIGNKAIFIHERLISDVGAGLVS